MQSEDERIEGHEERKMVCERVSEHLDFVGLDWKAGMRQRLPVQVSDLGAY